MKLKTPLFEATIVSIQRVGKTAVSCKLVNRKWKGDIGINKTPSTEYVFDTRDPDFKITGHMGQQIQL